MNSKEEELLKEIICYIKDNKRIPPMRYLQKKLRYKSVNSITELIKSLEKQNYLIRNNEGKLVLNKTSENYQTNIKNIKIINANNKNICLYLDKTEKYIAYQIHKNCFNKLGIFRNDILIIKKTKKLKDNNLGLFIIDNKYRIMSYHYKEGFYILNDDEEILLSKVKIIGKVIIIEKNLENTQSF